MKIAQTFLSFLPSFHSSVALNRVQSGMNIFNNSLTMQAIFFTDSDNFFKIFLFFFFCLLELCNKRESFRFCRCFKWETNIGDWTRKMFFPALRISCSMQFQLSEILGKMNLKNCNWSLLCHYLLSSDVSQMLRLSVLLKKSHKYKHKKRTDIAQIFRKQFSIVWHFREILFVIARRPKKKNKFIVHCKLMKT